MTMYNMFSGGFLFDIAYIAMDVRDMAFVKVMLGMVMV